VVRFSTFAVSRTYCRWGRRADSGRTKHVATGKCWRCWPRPNNGIHSDGAYAPRYTAVRREGCHLHRHIPEDRIATRAPWECTSQRSSARCFRQKPAHGPQVFRTVLSLCILQVASWASVRGAGRATGARFSISKLRARARNSCSAAPQPGALRNRKKVAALVANAQEFGAHPRRAWHVRAAIFAGQIG